MRGRYEKRKMPSITKKIAMCTLVLLCICIASLIIVLFHFNGLLSRINHVKVSDLPYSEKSATDSTEPSGKRKHEDDVVVSTEVITPDEMYAGSSDDYINFLVVGQAAREGETERFADTMVLCTLNTHTKTLTMTSILRDAFIKMPDYRGHTGGRIKLTTIYHLGYIFGNGIAGSMELMDLTLFENFGIEVDHNFEIDFDCFVEAIDMLGGIDIEVTDAEAMYLNDDEVWVNHKIRPGMAHLDGMETLCYARMRKAEGDGESDIKRTSRQRKVIEVIISKLRTKSVAELQKIAQDILPYISTSMDNAEITKSILTLLPLLPDLKIAESGTCPSEYSGDMVDIYGDGIYHSVLRFNEDNTKSAMRMITKGEQG